MRWLVTGVSGLVGSNFVCEANLKGNHVIYACYRCHPFALKGVKTFALDLRDSSAVEAILDQYRPDIIVHCAAETRVDYCESNPHEAYLLNVGCTESLARAAEARAAKLIYISTDSVFDGRTGFYDECHKPGPINVYATTKLVGEDKIRENVTNYLIIRTNVFGWSPRKGQGLAEWILSRVEQGMQVPGFTDIVFSPILTNSLAGILLLAVERDFRGLVHVGSRNAMTKFDFARNLCLAFGCDPALIVPASSSEAGLKAARPRNTSLNTSKISEALVIEMPTVEDGVRQFRQLRDSGYSCRLEATLRAAI